MLSRVGTRALLAGSLLVCSVTTSSMPPVDGRQQRPTAPAAVPADDPGCRSCLSEATSLFARGKDLDAADLLHQWSERCPRSAQLHLLLSTICIRLGRRQEAEAEAARATTLAPQLTGAHFQYALALMSNDRPPQALREFEQVTQLDPTNYEAWSSLASLYREMHQDDKAQESAAKAAELEPHTRATRFATIANLRRAGKYTEARQEIKRLLESDAAPEQGAELARQALLVGAFEEAAEAARRMSDAYPSAAEPLTLSCLSQLCRRDYAECGSSAQRLLKLQPQSCEAQAFQALALAGEHKTEAAQNAVDAAAKAAPDAGIVLLGRGAVQLQQAKYEAAEESLRGCLAVDDSNNKMQGVPHALALAMLTELYQKTGHDSQAREQLQALASDKRFAGFTTSMAP